MFRDYARVIHAKARPADPSYLKICVACAKVEVWAEHHFPSFIRISSGGGAGLSSSIALEDARGKVVHAATLREQARKQARFQQAMSTTGVDASASPPLWMFAAMIAVALIIFGTGAAALFVMAKLGWLGDD